MAMPGIGDERALARDRLLGWGVRLQPILPGLDLGQDIALDVGEHGRDLARVSGIDNLAQDLTIALTTMLGSDVFNTSFGFDGLNALADEVDPVLVRERVRIGVIRVLNNDPRVRRIVDVKLLDNRLGTDNPAAADVDREEALRIDPRTLWIRVGFETIAGDPLTVDLGRLDANG